MQQSEVKCSPCRDAAKRSEPGRATAVRFEQVGLVRSAGIGLAALVACVSSFLIWETPEDDRRFCQSTCR